MKSFVNVTSVTRMVLTGGRQFNHGTDLAIWLYLNLTNQWKANDWTSENHSPDGFIPRPTRTMASKECSDNSGHCLAERAAQWHRRVYLLCGRSALLHHPVESPAGRTRGGLMFPSHSRYEFKWKASRILTANGTQAEVVWTRPPPLFTRANPYACADSIIKIRAQLLLKMRQN